MRAPVSRENSLPPTSSTDGTGQPAEWLALLECAAPRAKFDRLAGLSQNSFSWPKLLHLAEDHGLVPLLAERVKNLDPSFVSREIRATLYESRRSHAVFALQLTAELFRLLQRFAEAGLETLLTKGPALSVRCYGDPGMRQYGDLDLIVREKDIRRATQAMLDLAYEPRDPLTAIDAKKIPGEYAFQKPGTDLLVEFHTERTFRYHPRRLLIERLFERRASVTIDGRDVPALSLEDELVLICVHGAELPAQVEANVRSDRAVSKLAAQIESRLASREPRSIGILQRAVFRIRMRGGLLAGAAYLLRL